MTGLDGQVLLFIQDNIRCGFLNLIFPNITHLGDAGVFWIMLTIIMMFFKRTRKAAICSAIALVCSVIICNGVLKNLIGRTRPYEVVDGLTCIVQLATDPSFPSGHTSASFASAVAMYRNIPRKWGIVLIVLAALIGFSRLYVGIHYPTDVLAGLVIGILLGILANVIYDKVSAIKAKSNAGTEEEV